VAADVAIGGHHVLAGAHLRHLLEHRLGLIERGELGHLRDEGGVLHWLHRVLLLKLDGEELQEIFLAQNSFLGRSSGDGRGILVSSLGARGRVDLHKIRRRCEDGPAM
jgi:hypothetical protein